MITTVPSIPEGENPAGMVAVIVCACDTEITRSLLSPAMLGPGADAAAAAWRDRELTLKHLEGCPGPVTNFVFDGDCGHLAAFGVIAS